MTMVKISTYEGAMDQDVVSMVHMATAELSPIFSMMLAEGQIQAATDEKFFWYGSGIGIESTQIDSGVLNGASTTLTVDSSSVFRVGDLVMSATTQEMMQVSSIPSATQIVVVRGIGDTVGASASVADNVVLYRVARAVGEGSDSPSGTATGKTEFWNHVQTFREPVEISGRMKRTKQKVEDERKFQRRAALLRLQRDIEQTLLHGVRSKHTNAEGEDVTTMGGLRESIVSNVAAIGGTLSKAAFHAAAAQFFATGSPVKLLVAGSTLAQTITDLYEDKLRLTPADSTVGLMVKNVDTPHGRLQLVYHRGLVGTMAGDGLVIDPVQLKIRPTEGGMPSLKTDTEAKGKDASRDEFFGEFGLEYGNESEHGQITGVTGAA